MLMEEQSSGSVPEVARFRESTGKEGRSLCDGRTRMTWPTSSGMSISGFDLGQMEASSDADMVLDQVLQ